MGVRLLNLQYIIEGFLQTKVPLIAFNGNQFTPFLALDDIGIYVFIPQLVRFFNLHLHQAIDLFFYGIIALSFSLAIFGFCLLYSSYFAKTIATCWLAALFYFVIKFGVNEVYLAYLASSLGIIPLFLYFITKKNSSYLFYLFLLLSGSALATLHYIRAQSGLGTIVFLLVMLATYYGFSYKKKLLLISFLVCGFLPPIIYFNSIIKTYETYAQQNFKEFKEFPTRHPFWHPIYLGFGFLNFSNEDNIRWDDHFGYQKAKQHSPTVTEYDLDEYEKIIKEEMFLLWKKQRFFVLFTIFAKIGVLLFYLFVFSNIGLLVRLFFSNPWQLELAFFCSFFCNALFPLIAMPNFCYSIGFIGIATLYGIVSTALFSKEEFLMRCNFLRKKVMVN